MIRNALLLFLTATCFILQPAYAADPAKAKAAAPAPAAAPAEKAVQPMLPMSTVLQNLKMNGYEIIGKVELENDVYDIDAMSPQGKELAITMNAHSGEITSPKQNPLPRISLMEAVRRVEGSGYHQVSKVEYGSGKYVVKALDEKDKKVKLKVDGTTGEITKAWF
jgi:uncharacterized membrane protein YkoI